VFGSVAQPNETAKWTIAVRLMVYAAAVPGALPSSWLSRQQEHKRLPWPRYELLRWGARTHVRPSRGRILPHFNDFIQPDKYLLDPERMLCNGSALWQYGFEEPEWSLDHGQSLLKV
jgi:hypothetical protein